MVSVKPSPNCSEAGFSEVEWLFRISATADIDNGMVDVNINTVRIKQPIRMILSLCSTLLLVPSGNNEAKGPNQRVPSESYYLNQCVFHIFQWIRGGSIIAL